MWMRLLAVLLLLISHHGVAQPVPAKPLEHDPRSIAIDVPTPTNVVEAMLKMADVGRADYVIDLGSGDGRIVLAAVKQFGARGGLGVDINAKAVENANGKAAEAGIADRAKFEARDLFETDVSPATVVTLYLFPSAMPRLQDKLLRELKPGTRVVSHDFPFPDWRIERVSILRAPDKTVAISPGEATLYLYVVPARTEQR